MGRLTRDPELKYTPNNVSVCTITLAVERNVADANGQRQADFIDVVAWRQTAEFVSKYFRKGLLVAVEGRLQTRKWQDKYQQSRVTFEVMADSVYFAERTDSTPQRQSNPQPGSYGDPAYGGYAPQTPSGGYAPQNSAGTYQSGGNYSGGYQRPAAPVQTPQQQSFGNLDVDPDDDDDVPF